MLTFFFLNALYISEKERKGMKFIRKGKERLGTGNGIKKVQISTSFETLQKHDFKTKNANINFDFVLSRIYDINCQINTVYKTCGKENKARIALSRVEEHRTARIKIIQHPSFIPANQKKGLQIQSLMLTPSKNSNCMFSLEK
jgi:hypothetical protein